MFATVSRFENVLFGEFRRLQREAEAVGSFAAVSVNTTPQKIEIFLSAPGIDPRALDVSIEKNVLRVSGKREVQLDAKATRSRQERYSGEFQRVLTLPQDVDSERVEASYVDGIVRISVQRREAPKPRQIEIH
jgi:HSP20 family protein